jgi:hypothetical protein
MMASPYEIALGHLRSARTVLAGLPGFEVRRALDAIEVATFRLEVAEQDGPALCRSGACPRCGERGWVTARGICLPCMADAVKGQEE